MRPTEPPVPPSAEKVPLGYAALLGLLGSVGAVLASILRGKFAALFLGPSGVGMGAEVLQWATLTNVPVAGFSGPALTQALLQPDLKSATGTSAIVSASITWTAVVSLVVGFVAIAFAPFALPEPWGASSRGLVALSVVALSATSIVSVLNTTLIASGRLRTVATQQLAFSLVGAAVMGVLMWLFALKGQFIGLAAVAVLSIPFYLKSVRTTDSNRLRLRVNFDRKFFLGAVRTGAVSLIAGAAIQGALFTIRWALEATGGSSWNGQFQAAWAVGSLYLSMLLNGLGSLVHPRYAMAIDAVALTKEVDDAGKFVMNIVPPVILGVLAIREFGITVLYSHAFDTAVGILGWQLAGDTAKCLSWVYAGPLLVRGRRRAFLLTETVAALSLAVGAVLLIPKYGAAGAGMAYCISCAIYAPVCAVVLSVSCGVDVQWRRLIHAGTLTLTFVLFVAYLDPNVWARMLSFVFALFWFWRAGGLSRALGQFRRRLIPLKQGGP